MKFTKERNKRIHLWCEKLQSIVVSSQNSQNHIHFEYLLANVSKSNSVISNHSIITHSQSLSCLKFQI